MRNVILALAATMIFAGCQPAKPQAAGEYRTRADDPRRDSSAAGDHNAEGVHHLEKGRLDEAEKNFKAALAADMFFGPAHNNLGMVYYRQKKYYLAAWEFQYAIKLMPNKAEPKCNLGAVYDAVGKLDDAAKCYDEALTIEPDAVEVAANLARIYVRSNRKDERTRQLLHEIVMKDTRPDWAQWAREKLLMLGQPTSAPADGG